MLACVRVCGCGAVFVLCCVVWCVCVAGAVMIVGSLHGGGGASSHPWVTAWGCSLVGTRSRVLHLLAGISTGYRIKYRFSVDSV